MKFSRCCFEMQQLTLIISFVYSKESELKRLRSTLSTLKQVNKGFKNFTITHACHAATNQGYHMPKELIRVNKLEASKVSYLIILKPCMDY